MSEENLKKRVNNLEKAFVAMHGVLSQLMPPALDEEATELICDLYNSNKSLGGLQETKPFFLKESI